MSDGPRTLLLSGAQGLLGRAVARAWLAAPDADVRVVGFGRSPRLPDRYPYEIDIGGVVRPAHLPAGPGAGERERPPRDIGGVVRPAHLPAGVRAVEDDDRYTYQQCDLTDQAAMDELVAQVRPDVVVHAAAALRDDDPATLVRTNVDGTRLLATACRSTPSVQRFLLVSSGSVHGLDAAVAAGVEPDPYPVSKAGSERVAASVLHATDVALDVCRVFNLVGPGLQTRHLPSQVAATLVAVRAGRTDPVLRLGSLGTSRDLVDVGDAAAAVVACARRTGEPAGATLDVGSGTSTLMRDLVALLLRLAGLADLVQVHEGSPRPYDPPSLVADVHALVELGAAATTPLEQSCRALLDYLTVQLDATG